MKGSDLDTGTRFPFSWRSHEAGWRFLFDLAIAGGSLKCAPGDLVLDYAAGTGWVSEMLNRFGYRTVALDNDPEAIEIARMRFSYDSRLCVERARFVVGDGQSLPFDSDTFDGVVCMNALHHMPDYRASLSEIHRVLKPGCRAVFSEPGSAHSATPLSRMMVEQYSDVEKDVIIDEIFQIARSVGFEAVYLKPFVYPGHYTVDYYGWQRAKKGDTAGTCLDPAYLHRIVEETHPIFILVKAGKKRVTSANPGVLSARIALEEFALYRDEGTLEATFKVKVTNLGDCIWLSGRREFGGYVVLGARLLDSTGRLVSDALDRTWLPRDVAPREEVELAGVIKLGELPGGRYILRLDMVDEFICWFEERGPGYLDVEINV